MLPQLTQSELTLIKVMWRRGELSAREIHEAVADELGWAYSTTRTTIERMVHKKVVKKRAFHGLHLYEPAITRAAGIAGLVRDFARDVLDHNHVPVVSLLEKNDVLDEDELSELRALLEKDDETGR
jgi:predicted transcriptional regulator